MILEGLLIARDDACVAKYIDFFADIARKEGRRGAQSMFGPGV